MLSGCTSPPPIEPPLPPKPPFTAPDHFSGEMARRHIDALGSLGSRGPGAAGDLAARLYLSRAFEAAGAEVRTLMDGARTHLIADLRGDSEDRLLLVAAYPALERDEWIGDGGAALLLELARVLPREKPHYSIRFALAETQEVVAERAVGIEDVEDSATANATRGDREGGTPSDRSVTGSRDARAQVVAAGESLARALSEFDGFRGNRGVIVFDGVGREGLRVARDLRSHPVYRDVFWSSGQSLDFASVFPAEVVWTSPRSLHLGFEERGIDGILAIVDEARARPEFDAMRTNGSPSASSFDAIGLVTLEALDRIMHRLSRIDGFGSVPTADPSLTGARPAAPEQASPQVPETAPSS